ncbi:Prevent-host-death family protein (fragment) [Rhizobium mesoamericanum STM3625]|uniref:Prevent-host-death family protein n=2 Tax=Rhizobium mesoamericanum TaxID=1079800 RepID=K0Q5N7_9HYPH
MANAGEPMAKVVPLEEADASKKQRIGFIRGMISVPDDFDTIITDEIEEMFSDGKQFSE